MCTELPDPSFWVKYMSSKVERYLLKQPSPDLHRLVNVLRQPTPHWPEQVNLFLSGSCVVDQLGGPPGRQLVGDWSPLGNRVGRSLSGTSSEVFISGPTAQEVGTLYFLVCLGELQFMRMSVSRI